MREKYTHTTLNLWMLQAFPSSLFTYLKKKLLLFVDILYHNLSSLRKPTLERSPRYLVFYAIFEVIISRNNEIFLTYIFNVYGAI